MTVRIPPMLEIKIFPNVIHLRKFGISPILGTNRSWDAIIFNEGRPGRAGQVCHLGSLVEKFGVAIWGRVRGAFNWVFMAPL